MEIRDPFAHEASHALVYDALNITVARVWVQYDDEGRGGGKTERGAGVEMTHGCGVLEFMSGGGVLVLIFAQPFDRTINRIKSDMCTILPLLGFTSEQEARTQLERLRMATHDFVGEWVLIHKDPIMRLATLLQQSPIEDQRWELSGDALREAIQRCWGGIKPSAAVTQAFADTGWKKILDQTVQLADAVEWQTQVLRHCDEDRSSQHPPDNG